MPTHLHGRGPLVVTVALGLAVTAARPDEATLRDGRRLPGTLTHRTTWHFLPTGKSEPLPVSSLLSVRLEPGSAAPFRAGTVHRVTLRSGDWLTGILLDANEKTLSLRMAWADKVMLPRVAVTAVTQQPGWALVYLDDLTDGLKGWKVEGKVEQPARSGLVLGTPGQTVEHTLAVPIEEGRIGVNFHDSREATGATWLAEAEFRTPAGPRLVTVTLAGGKDMSAVVGGIEGISAPLPRAPGWHRLTVQFAPSSMRVVADDVVLWHHLKHGPGGPLLRWRLVCRKADGQLARGSLSFKDFALHRAVDEPRRPAGDPSQDEVWLLDGDQLFGHILRAEGRSVVLEGSFGRCTLPWSLVRGIYPRRQPGAAPLAASPGQVRLWIANGSNAEPDRLEGVVLSLDERRCRFRHALLGEVELERGRVVRVQWVP
jgi:hypothetical protein